MRCREGVGSNAPSRWQRVKRDKSTATTNVIFAGLEQGYTLREHEMQGSGWLKRTVCFAVDRAWFEPDGFDPFVAQFEPLCRWTASHTLQQKSAALS